MRRCTLNVVCRTPSALENASSSSPCMMSAYERNLKTQTVFEIVWVFTLGAVTRKIGLTIVNFSV
jgi:hypothetical protein